MKKIKTIFITSFLIFNFISCNINDKIDEIENNLTPTSEKIVNIWHLQTRKINEVEIPLTDCDRENLYDIANNGMLIFYNHQLSNTDCISQTISGQYTKIGNLMEIIFDEVINDESSYSIEILSVTDTNLTWSRTDSNGNSIIESFN